MLSLFRVISQRGTSTMAQSMPSESAAKAQSTPSESAATAQSTRSESASFVWGGLTWHKGAVNPDGSLRSCYTEQGGTWYFTYYPLGIKFSETYIRLHGKRHTSRTYRNWHCPSLEEASEALNLPMRETSNPFGTTR
jgi:hypothetical protein